MKRILTCFIVFITLTLHAERVEYVKFATNGSHHWGVLNGSWVHVLNKAPWLKASKTGKRYKYNKLNLLPPASPSKVLAVGLNYRSHSGNSGATRPELFAKFPSSLQTNGKVFVPIDASSIHYEGELVIVIGKKLKNGNERQAAAAIFGVTAGNDVSERRWQSSDLQWIRGKASDGFGPMSSVLVRGVDYSDLMITTRVNGKIRQRESTKNLLHSPVKIVAWTSRYITLEPGDVIFTGTPGRTQSIKNGDVVEVHIEKVGTLKNTFIWGK